MCLNSLRPEVSISINFACYIKKIISVISRFIKSNRRLNDKDKGLRWQTKTNGPTFDQSSLIALGDWFECIG